jgi:hypothetical protein
MDKRMVMCNACCGIGRDAEYCWDPETDEKWERDAVCLDCDGSGEVEDW